MPDACIFVCVSCKANEPRQSDETQQCLGTNRNMVSNGAGADQSEAAEEVQSVCEESDRFLFLAFQVDRCACFGLHFLSPSQLLPFWGKTKPATPLSTRYDRMCEMAVFMTNPVE
ncbi:unnamed protein product [Protopolystoma xenopodis]|uniref:Uncharacterized protein n=1 Tax=Protopolystoma xenopodis TaxID=117903 RepID=A0A3S5CTT4_9PLAT|nr:unnamed protein product [Protopolystoma xenopodis]